LRDVGKLFAWDRPRAQRRVVAIASSAATALCATRCLLSPNYAPSWASVTGLTPPVPRLDALGGEGAPSDGSS